MRIKISVLFFIISSFMVLADSEKNIIELDTKPVNYIKKGYRGFVETGVGGDIKNGSPSFFFSTTHGRQLSRWYYMGGGLSYTQTYAKQFYREPNNPTKFYYNDPHKLIHAFMDMRLTVPTRSRFYPYADLKLGIGANESGWILHSQAGVRYALNNLLGVSAGLYFTRMNTWVVHHPVMGFAASFDF